MDRTASPCVNFFQYACGAWNQLHVIPEDKSSISTFEVLADQLQVSLKRVLEEPPNNEDNEATLKAKMFYKSCMDIRGYNENFSRTRPPIELPPSFARTPKRKSRKRADE